MTKLISLFLTLGIALWPSQASADEPDTLTLLREYTREHVTVIPLDDPPDWLVVDGWGRMVLDNGRALTAALGCHGRDDIRYYYRSHALHMADLERDGVKGLAMRAWIAQSRLDDTDEHELAHAVHCMATGDTESPMSDEAVRATYAALGLDPGLWVPRPDTFPGGSYYCWAAAEDGAEPNERAWGEWLACSVSRAIEAKEASR